MLLANPHCATIRRIRGLHHRKDREASGLFFVEGIHNVAEALQAGAAVTELIVAPALLKSHFAHTLIAGGRARGLPCLEVTEEIFKSLSAKEHPQGLGALVGQRWSALTDICATPALCWIALSGTQDPGNLGTILRTSDAVGGGGVILLGHTTDPYDPEAVRASMGAIFSQQVVRSDLHALHRWQQSHPCFVVGTSGAATTDYRAIAYPQPLLIFMGSEQHGLSPEEQEICDVIVRIPMVGRSDSLNLAVATAVLLYEVFNQRRAPG